MSAPTPFAASTTPAALARELEAGADLRLLDVRTPAEFETAHIPGSHNLPLDQLPAYVGALRDAPAPLVLVCQRGNRAREAAVLLRSGGREAGDRVLEGGVAAWEADGLPLVRGRERWSLERQVRGVAGSLVLVGALGGLFVARPLAALAAFVGGGLVFSALSNTCGMANLLARLPYNQGPGCDPAAAVAALTAPPAAARSVSANGATVQPA